MSNKPTYEELEKEINELRQAKETVRIERDQLQALMTGLSRAEIGIDIVGIDYSIIYQNQILEDRFGNCIGQLCYKNYMDMEEPCDVCPIRKAIKSNKVEVFELIGKDGRNYEVISIPLPNPDGTVEKALEVVRDITESKKIEKSLQKTIGRFNIATSAIKMGIWDWDIQKNELIWDDGMYELYGIQPENISGAYQAWLDRVHPDDKKYCDKVSEQARRGEIEYKTEFRIVRPDGTIKFLMASGKVLRDSNGNPVRMIGVDFDITKHKETEEQLQEINMVFTILLEHSPVYIFFKDHNIRPIYLSKNYEKMLGMPIGKLLGKTMDDLFPSDMAKDMIADDKKIIEEGKIVETNEELNGRYFSTIKFPITLPGKPSMLAGFTLDITERKQAEEEKRMIEKRLRQAQKMEVVGTLAGGIAHDFNNILFPIMAYVELMLEEAPTGSSLQKNLHEVFTSSIRARDLVKQILTLSHQAEIELKPLKIQLIIKEVMQLIKSTLPSTITIKQHINKNCGMVLADPTNIHQIAMNLITNAYHAMEESGGTLTVKLSEVTISTDDLTLLNLSPGTFVCFSVSDTGSGIEKHILDRIFEPYYTTKPTGKGTGLGLSVVHGLLNSYNGDIRVNSVPGKGSVFNVYLPIIGSNLEETTITKNISIPGGEEHILLVDDEAEILKVVKLILESLGYQVTTQTSSIEALELFLSTPEKFNLVITDMTMPNMTGLKLALELKKIKKDVPVIICTGFSEKISPEKAEALGIKGFLMKPITRVDLAKQIRKVLDIKKEG